MTWKPRETKWDWRKFLSADEKAVLKQADEAKAMWRTLNADRATIQNRAIQRAKYAAGLKTSAKA